MAYTETDLSKLVTEMRRPFQTSTGYTGGRDALWEHWRNLRMRREKPWLPPELEKMLGEGYADRLSFRDTKPEKQVNRLTQRLGANAVQFSVKGRGDLGPRDSHRLEKVEDWIRGAWEHLDPVGLIDQRARRHQAGDGLAFFELEMLPHFTPPPEQAGESDSEYLTRVDSARQEYALPCRLDAPDPRSLYYLPTDLKAWPNIVAKVINLPLIDVQNKWTSNGKRLAYKGEDNKLEVNDFVYGSEQAPVASPMEIGKMVRFVLIATGDRIYHLVYDQCFSSGLSFDSLGDVPSLRLMGDYPNPLGRPPFYPMAARLTGDPDPAYATEPLAKELLDMAPTINQLLTIRAMHGMLDALKPWPLHNTMPDDDTKNPPVMQKFRPGFMELPQGMTLGTWPSNPIPDFEKFYQQINESYGLEDTSLSGAAQAGVIGRSTPAWTVAQFREETSSFFIEPLDMRAAAIREVTLDVMKLCYRASVKDKSPIYVTAATRSKKRPEIGRVDLKVGISEEEFKQPFRLEVTIEAQTQSERAANTEYGRRLLQDGVISEESYIEAYTPIQDPVQEQRRKDRESLQKPMRARAAAIAEQLAAEQLRQVYGPLADAVLGTGQMQPGADEGEPVDNPQEEGPESMGNSGLNGSGPIMPGQGMSLQQPALSQRILPQPSMSNGGGPR